MDTNTVRIGVVDDDPKLVELVLRYLHQHGFPGAVALAPAALADGRPVAADLLILDVMMPGLDGFELLKRIRRHSQVGVIFLTARSEIYDRVVGFELGADDYLPKPFEPRELLARIQALLRRLRGRGAGPGADAGEDAAPAAPADQPGGGGAPRLDRAGRLVFEEFTFDQDRQVVIRDGREQALTTWEFQLLRLFCANPQLVLSRQQITDWLETHAFGSYDRAIDAGIARLRRKIERQPGEPGVLVTVRGRGYQLVVRPRRPEGS